MAVCSATKDELIKEYIKNSNLRHVAIIMDGNRRWAKSRFLPSAAGHSEGVKSLRRAVLACKKWNIEALTVYAFSTENWGRKQDEVDFLMELLAKTIAGEMHDLHKNNVVIRIIGDLSRLNDKLGSVLNEAMEMTRNNTGLKFQIAINYGARDEIKNAVREIATLVKEGKLTPEEISEDTISEHLYTRNLPDPDLLIRTGGEQRISNYLLWQIAYSEFFVTDKLWPEFDDEVFAEAIEWCANRNRRFGKD